MNPHTCLKTGLNMARDKRPMTTIYKGQSSTFDMPGWYCNESGESVHSGEDMKVSDAALKALMHAHTLSRRPCESGDP